MTSLPHKAILLTAHLLLLSLLLPLSGAAVEERVFTQVATEEKVVALTFDDGPHPRNTPAILDLLAEYDAKATFFVIGKNMELYGEAAKRAASEGHELGNHTYGHPALAKLTSRGLLEEILKNEELIRRVSGQQPTLFRPPEGYCTGEVRRVAAENGFSVILWSIDTRDWAGVATDRIVDTVMKNTVPGSIILFHDYSGKNCHTVSALKEILPRLDAAGFRFVTVSELLTFVKTPVVNPGD